MTRRVVLASLGTALPVVSILGAPRVAPGEAQMFNVTRRTSLHSRESPQSDGNGPATARVRPRHRTPGGHCYVGHNPGRSRTRATGPHFGRGRLGPLADQLREAGQPSPADDEIR